MVAEGTEDREIKRVSTLENFKHWQNKNGSGFLNLVSYFECFISSDLVWKGWLSDLISHVLL